MSTFQEDVLEILNLMKPITELTEHLKQHINEIYPKIILIRKRILEKKPHGYESSLLALDEVTASVMRMNNHLN